MRPILEPKQIDESALKSIESFHASVVQDVQKAIQANDWVIVGMAQNPFVRNARKLLNRNAIAYTYIEHGSYLSKWKVRLAIKLWSGWPTFPQVFHKGKLIGGYTDLVKYLGNQ